MEGYSGFENSDLERKLKQERVGRIFVGGLATDYCVKYTVLDALEKKFDVILLTDVTMGINRNLDDVEKAIREMSKKGAKKATFYDLK